MMNLLNEISPVMELKLRERQSNMIRVTTKIWSTFLYSFSLATLSLLMNQNHDPFNLAYNKPILVSD